MFRCHLIDGEVPTLGFLTPYESPTKVGTGPLIPIAKELKSWVVF